MRKININKEGLFALVMKHGGSQAKAADELGVTRERVRQLWNSYELGPCPRRARADEIMRLVAAQKNTSPKTIAAEHSIPIGGVNYARRRLGLVMSKRRQGLIRRKPELDEAARLYQQGYSSNEIGKMLSRGSSNIRQALRTRGIKLRTRKYGQKLWLDRHDHKYGKRSRPVTGGEEEK